MRVLVLVRQACTLEGLVCLKPSWHYLLGLELEDIWRFFCGWQN